MALDPEEDKRRRAARARARYAADPEKYRAKERAVYAADPNPARERAANDRARAKGEARPHGSAGGRATAALRAAARAAAAVTVPVPHSGNLADTGWQDRAACAGMDAELFFPETGVTSEARETCLGCPVRAECLGFAMSFPKTQLVGFWGGTTASQRSKIGRVPRRAAS